MIVSQNRAEEGMKGQKRQFSRQLKALWAIGDRTGHKKAGGGSTRQFKAMEDNVWWFIRISK